MILLFPMLYVPGWPVSPTARPPGRSGHEHERLRQEDGAPSSRCREPRSVRQVSRRNLQGVVFHINLVGHVSSSSPGWPRCRGSVGKHTSPGRRPLRPSEVRIGLFLLMFVSFLHISGLHQCYSILFYIICGRRIWPFRKWPFLWLRYKHVIFVICTNICPGPSSGQRCQGWKELCSRRGIYYLTIVSEKCYFYYLQPLGSAMVTIKMDDLEEERKGRLWLALLHGAYSYLFIYCLS